MWNAMRLQRRKRLPTTWLFGVLLAMMSSRADAQATSSGWQFELVPYGWAAVVSGSVTGENAGGPGLDIEQTWSDIFANLEFALMGSFEVRKGRWGGMADAVDFRVRGGGTLYGRRGFTSLSAEGFLAQKFYSAAAIYRVRQGGAPVDLMIGGRYALIGWDIDIELARPPVTIGERVLSDNRTWWDPYVGARIQQPLGKRWSLTGYGDVGGFGIGSRLSIQGLAAARFAFTSVISGSLGYRAISEDYDSDGFKYDIVNAGPVLGMAIRW